MSLRLIVIILFLHGIDSQSDVQKNEEEKYLENLPENEKRELFLRIRERIIEEVEPSEKKYKSGEALPDKELDKHNEYVSKILKDEVSKLRRQNSFRGNDTSEINSQTNIERSEEGKYIELLPKDDKQEILSKISRRIAEEIKPGETKYKSGEALPETELNKFSEYVSKLLKEEVNNLRRQISLRRGNIKAMENKTRNIRSVKDDNISNKTSLTDDKSSISDKNGKVQTYDATSSITTTKNGTLNDPSQSSNERSETTSIETITTVYKKNKHDKLLTKNKTNNKTNNSLNRTPDVGELRIPVQVIYDNKPLTKNITIGKNEKNNSNEAAEVVSEEKKGHVRTFKDETRRDNDDNPFDCTDSDGKWPNDSDIPRPSRDDSQITQIPDVPLDSQMDVAGRYKEKRMPKEDYRSKNNDTKKVTVKSTISNSMFDLPLETVTPNVLHEAAHNILLALQNNTRKVKSGKNAIVMNDKNNKKNTTDGISKNIIIESELPVKDNITTPVTVNITSVNSTSDKDPEQPVKIDNSTVKHEPKSRLFKVNVGIDENTLHLEENKLNRVEKPNKGYVVYEVLPGQDPFVVDKNSKIIVPTTEKVEEVKQSAARKDFEDDLTSDSLKNDDRRNEGAGKEGVESPYYVPVHNYAPDNAYFNPYNRFGLNNEDSQEIAVMRQRIISHEERDITNDDTKILKMSNNGTKDVKRTSEFFVKPNYEGSSEQKLKLILDSYEDDVLSTKNTNKKYYEQLNKKTLDLNVGTHPKNYILKRNLKSALSAIRNMFNKRNALDNDQKTDVLSEEINVGQRNKKRPLFREKDNSITPQPKTVMVYPKLSDDIDQDYYFGRFKGKHSKGHNVGKPKYPKILIVSKDYRKSARYMKYGIDNIDNSPQYSSLRTYDLRSFSYNMTHKSSNNSKHNNTKKLTLEEIDKIVEMTPAVDQVAVLLLLDKMRERNQRRFRSKPTKDSEIEYFIELMQTMIETDEQALHHYDWLITTVDIRSGVHKLTEMIDALRDGERLHPSDKELLKYIVYLYKESQNDLLQDLERYGSRDKSENSKENKLISIIKQMFALRRYSKPEMLDPDLKEFELFVCDIEEELYDLHNAIKNIALISTYKTARFFKNLKELLNLNAPTRSHILQFLLHFAVSKLFELIEESAKDGMELDYQKYVWKNSEKIRTTKQEFIYVLKFLFELKKIMS